jgi:hypothetical protein
MAARAAAEHSRTNHPLSADLHRNEREHMQFYLGAHHAHWLAVSPRPLFVSHRTLHKRRTLPRARTTWALDSGGFTELSQHGRWRVSARDYADAVRRYQAEIGSLAWASSQDWMCEPAITARTGLTVAEHQARTIRSYLDLRDLAPDVPWSPVLQGWTYGDYLDHAEAFERLGVDLAALPVVGIGSVCRRQHTIRSALLVSELARAGLRLHGFGFKLTGLRSVHRELASADSMAWSFHARRERNGGQNSLAFALSWYEEHVATLSEA